MTSRATRTIGAKSPFSYALPHRVTRTARREGTRAGRGAADRAEVVATRGAWAQCARAVSAVGCMTREYVGRDKGVRARDDVCGTPRRDETSRERNVRMVKKIICGGGDVGASKVVNRESSRREVHMVGWGVHVSRDWK